MHMKKIKGDIGVTAAIADLTKLGWNVSVPISEHTKYDLVIEKDNVCYRVQVRYTSMKNGVLNVKLRSCWADKHGCHTKDRKSGDFDILAVYCPQNNQLYYIKDSMFTNSTGVNIRIEKPKRMTSQIRWWGQDLQSI
jgi:hypothetical protein